MSVIDAVCSEDEFGPEKRDGSGKQPPPRVDVTRDSNGPEENRRGEGDTKPAEDAAGGDDEDELARRYGLRKTTAYARREGSSREGVRLKEAVRQDGHRKKLREQGALALVPHSRADAIRSADSFEAWYNEDVTRKIEQVRTYRAAQRKPLQEQQARWLQYGRRVDAVRGWRRWLVLWLLELN